MAQVVRALVFLALLGSVAHAGPGIGSKVYTVYTGSSPSCGGIPCIWGDTVTGKLKLRTAGSVDYLLGEADRITNSASDPGAPVAGQCIYNTSSGKIRCYQSGAWYNWGDPVGGPATEAVFSRTCTLTSATAITPVNCLSNADVPSGQKAYLLGWHAKINGATAWATTANCWIQDTGGTSVIFVTTAVAAMTGNAFLVDGTASITQQTPYSLGTGGTTDLGLEIACNANGTGSNWVVTVYGVIK